MNPSLRGEQGHENEEEAKSALEREGRRLSSRVAGQLRDGIKGGLEAVELTRLES